MCICTYIGGLMGYKYIYIYWRADGRYMYISKKLQFAAYGQFVLVFVENTFLFLELG